jgi:hypothetical protein
MALAGVFADDGSGPSRNLQPPNQQQPSDLETTLQVESEDNNRRVFSHQPSAILTPSGAATVILAATGPDQSYAVQNEQSRSGLAALGFPAFPDLLKSWKKRASSSSSGGGGGGNSGGGWGGGKGGGGKGGGKGGGGKGGKGGGKKGGGKGGTT